MPDSQQLLNPQLSKTDAVKEWITDRIRWQMFLPNQRVPSVRKLAKQLGISSFTVMQAYEQLVAKNVLTAKQGSGFYVRAQKNAPAQPALIAARPPSIDTAWLVEHMFSQIPYHRAPGNGTPAPEWLHFEKLTACIRQVAAKSPQFSYEYPGLLGYFPLRELFWQAADEIGIQSEINQIITTNGASEAIHLVSSYLLHPGDTILVDDPSWFWLNSALEHQKINIVRVPRHADGPDLAIFEEMMARFHPKLYVTNTVLHNPTSYQLHPAIAHKILNLIYAYDSYILEDDIYQYYDPNPHSVRYATLDQCERVFYCTSISKIIGGTWRVGILLSPKQHMQKMAQHKMLITLTTSEFNERVVYQVLTEGAFRHHISTVQKKTYLAHQRLRKSLATIRLSYPKEAQTGLFLWVNVGVDSSQMAVAAAKDNWLIAPGRLFSEQTDARNYIRFNISTTSDEFLAWLQNYRQQHLPTAAAND